MQDPRALLGRTPSPRAVHSLDLAYISLSLSLPLSLPPPYKDIVMRYSDPWGYCSLRVPT